MRICGQIIGPAGINEKNFNLELNEEENHA